MFGLFAASAAEKETPKIASETKKPKRMAGRLPAKSQRENAKKDQAALLNRIQWRRGKMRHWIDDGRA
ncbi:MAG TPA: hypothetical protein QGG93_03525 [Verrucomicrobiota bacterium]|nr:hypothetical protein [Verrucomicrobiota bacterium]